MAAPDRISFSLEKCPCSAFEWSEGRISAGDYREETIVEVKGDFVSYVRFLYVFMAFEVHHGCQVCLWPAASVTLISNEGESEKSIRSFPLIMCVYSITVSKQTVLLVMTTAARGLNYVAHSLMWAVRFERRGISKEFK